MCKNMDPQEYSHIKAEIKGFMTPGKLQLTDQHIIFYNKKNGKSEQIKISQLELASFQKFAESWGIRMFLKNGTLRRFMGFKDSHKLKIAAFFKQAYKMDILDEELSVKGWNWGVAKFDGSALSFNVDKKTAFEIPLENVSKCSTGKNEVALEFHHTAHGPVNLMEMRFFIPPTDTESTIETFQKQVTDRAGAMGVPGDAIATFKEIQSVTPRGRYDVKIFPSFFQLHGKTFDYKIPTSSVVGLFVLPHKDGRQTFFVISLNPPIKQGQTRYHFLVLLFGPDEESSIVLTFTQQEVRNMSHGEFEDEISGPTCEVFSKVLKIITCKKITYSHDFVGHSGTSAIGCSYKAAAGYLYPLENAFIYVHKPPVYILFEDVSKVNFARSGGNTRSFDFELELKSGSIYTFNGIEKEEYAKLFEFVVSKKLDVKDKGLCSDVQKNEDFGKTGIDAYLERIKAEANLKDEEGDTTSTADGSSEDDDFKPGISESDISIDNDSLSESEDVASCSEDSESIKTGHHTKIKTGSKQHKPKTTPKVKGQSSVKPKRDVNKPKRPPAAFMIWLNTNRSEIKAKHPELKMTEIAKKGGELWRQLKDKSEWEKKAAEAKKVYVEAMQKYEASNKENIFNIKNQHVKKSIKQSPKRSPKKTKPHNIQSENQSGSTSVMDVHSVRLNEQTNRKLGGFTSKEFISNSDTTSDEEQDTVSGKYFRKKDSKLKETTQTQCEDEEEYSDTKSERSMHTTRSSTD